MNCNFIKFKQENIVMYLLKMNIQQLIDGSVVAHYDSKSDKNYQRPPIPAHYRKISKYFMTEMVPILPTAILAAISPSDIKEIDDKISINGKIRLVDGQHRIEGIKCLRDGYTKNSKQRFEHLEETFELPVILMVIDEVSSMLEIDAFININSKGKKVRTDLAEALKNQKFNSQMERGINPLDEDRLVSALGNNICKKLNTDSEWKGLIIQADENGNRNEQPISIMAFVKAIKPIVHNYIKANNLTVNVDNRNNIENELVELINDIWKVVENKWKECFKGNGQMYNAEYNICKGIGVVSLYSIYSDCMNEPEPMDKFKKIIDESPVEEGDWLVGGTFTGYSSSQGLNIVKQYIMGTVKTLDEYI